MKRAPAILTFACCLTSCIAYADAARAADGKRPQIAIDLSTGVLSQSNCAKPVGCGGQHILTLQIENPLLAIARGNAPVLVELDYSLLNPSGHRNTALCLSALVGGKLVQQCANPIDLTGGRLRQAGCAESDQFRDHPGWWVQEPWNDFHIWEHGVSLPGSTALAMPTPICIEAVCP